MMMMRAAHPQSHGTGNLEIGDCGSKCRQSRKILSASIGDMVTELNGQNPRGFLPS